MLYLNITYTYIHITYIYIHNIYTYNIYIYNIYALYQPILPFPLRCLELGTLESSPNQRSTLESPHMADPVPGSGSSPDPVPAPVPGRVPEGFTREGMAAEVWNPKNSR